MCQLWPQTDLGSNLDSTNALSPGPGDFTPEPPFPGWGCPRHLSGAKGMKDGHTCKAPDCAWALRAMQSLG